MESEVYDMGEKLMTEEQNNQLRLALSIFSGRVEPSSMDDRDMNLLGYDIYKFDYYGSPSADEIRGMCEDIVYGLIVRQVNSQAIKLLSDIVGNSRAYLRVHSYPARNYCTFCGGESTSHADAVVHTEKCPIAKAQKLVE